MLECKERKEKEKAEAEANKYFMIKETDFSDFVSENDGV
jgi:hypothetical protein